MFEAMLNKFWGECLFSTNIFMQLIFILHRFMHFSNRARLHLLLHTCILLFKFSVYGKVKWLWVCCELFAWLWLILMLLFSVRPNSFVIITANRVIHCNSDTPEEMHHWISLLQKPKGESKVDGQEFLVRGERKYMQLCVKLIFCL